MRSTAQRQIVSACCFLPQMRVDIPLQVSGPPRQRHASDECRRLLVHQSDDMPGDSRRTHRRRLVANVVADEGIRADRHTNNNETVGRCDAIIRIGQ